jgi:hypothetical protein
MSVFIYVWNGYNLAGDIRNKRRGWTWFRIFMISLIILIDIVALSQ